MHVYVARAELASVKRRWHCRGNQQSLFFPLNLTVRDLRSSPSPPPELIVISFAPESNPVRPAIGPYINYALIYNPLEIIRS